MTQDVPNVQVSDTSDDAQRTLAGKQKIINYIQA